MLKFMDFDRKYEPRIVGKKNMQTENHPTKLCCPTVLEVIYLNELLKLAILSFFSSTELELGGPHFC
jgi:hypothetical protein